MQEKDIIIPVILGQNIALNGRSPVFLATEKNTGRQLVIKEIRKIDLSIDYFQEAIYLYNNKHPNIVEISYAGESSCKNFVYLAMPYYKNGSLKERLQKPLSIRQIINYANNFLSGLHSIHQKNLVHLDIKPDNILLTDKNEAVLSDFGQANETNFKGISKSNKGLFDLLIPPENFIYQHQKTSRHTDIYQVGVTLYCLVNKIDIIQNANKVVQNQDFRGFIVNGTLYNKNKYAYHVNDKIKKIINKCLSIEPSQRPPSIQAILNELNSIVPQDSLDWEYSNMNNIESWELKKLKYFCSLNSNGLITITKNGKNHYHGNNKKELLDFLEFNDIIDNKGK